MDLNTWSIKLSWVQVLSMALVFKLNRGSGLGRLRAHSEPNPFTSLG